MIFIKKRHKDWATLKNKFYAPLLLAFSAFILFTSTVLHAGFIEEKNGKTIIHVKVWSLPDPSRNDTFTRAEVAAVNYFKEVFPKIFAKKYRDKYKANPEKYGNYNWDNVEIQLDKFSSIKVEGVETDLLAIAGGMAPDILYINFRKSHNYIFNDFLYPLDEYFATMTKEQKEFRINSKLWPVIYRKGPKGKKHYWAMPYGGALGKVLIYRKDLLDEFGIAHPDANWTWKDMMAACKKLTDAKRGTYGMMLGRGKHEAFLWLTFLWSAGGEVMVYNEDKDEWKCVFDSPEAAEALDFYIRLSAEKWYDEKGKIHRGYSSKDSSERGVKWERGEVGMNFSYIEENTMTRIKPDIHGIAPVPLGPTGMRGGELNSRMMGMFSQVKEAAVRDAAWEYMFFYDGKEAAKIKTKIMVEGGMGRFVNPKFLRMFGYEEVEKLSPRGWAENYEIAIKTGKPEPYGKNSNFAYELMTHPIQEAENLYRNDKLPEDKEARVKVLRKILQDACARANEIMIGKITPKEKTWRRIIAGIFLVGIIVSFFFVFKKIFKAFTPPSALQQKKRWNFKKYMWAYMLLIPAAATIVIWKYIPLVRGSGMAFFDYKLLGNSVFVGLDNFGNILFDFKWWCAIWNSLRYSFLVIGLTFLPPVLLAILLQEVPKGKLLFRIIYYLPAVIAGLVTILLWKQFYEPSAKGTLNFLLLKIPAIGFIALGLIMLILALVFAKRLHFYDMYFPMILFILAGILVFYTFFNFSIPILVHDKESVWQTIQAFPSRLFKFLPEPFHWLSDTETAMVACVIPMVWAGMGPGCLIYLAALKGIPEDYYEASDIDGANFIDKLLFIVFPTIKALIIINFVGVFIRSWYGATANILAMTGGGAETETAGLHIWYAAFTYLSFGPATAMAWMLAFMLIGFTVYQLRILSRVEFRTAATAKKDN